MQGGVSLPWLNVMGLNQAFPWDLRDLAIERDGGWEGGREKGAYSLLLEKTLAKDTFFQMVLIIKIKTPDTQGDDFSTF